MPIGDAQRELGRRLSRSKSHGDRLMQSRLNCDPRSTHQGDQLSACATREHLPGPSEGFIGKWSFQVVVWRPLTSLSTSHAAGNAARQIPFVGQVCRGRQYRVRPSQIEQLPIVLKGLPLVRALSEVALLLNVKSLKQRNWN